MFVFEHLINRAILLLGMGPVVQLFTAQAQPIVQCIEIIKDGFGHKQPPPQKLDLVLNLSLLPFRSRGAGHRLHHIVVHQGQEPGMEYPVL